ncbi:MAG: class I SAM-dependent methyltransferase [Nanoarchaeota archaeon]
MIQSKEKEWFDQWYLSNAVDDFQVFKDLIHPYKVSDLKGKTVLECGCGSGGHTRFFSKYAKSVVAVDLNTSQIAKERNKQLKNVDFLDEDIMSMHLSKKFDFVVAIGVIHHTMNPKATVHNLTNHVKFGGKLILLVYSKEGNSFSETIIEPMKKHLFRYFSRKKLYLVSKFIVICINFLLYSCYLLPLNFLAYYNYATVFRKLSFDRKVLAVFDRLNAPRTFFFNLKQAKNLLDSKQFKRVIVSSYRGGVTWRISGEKL